MRTTTPATKISTTPAARLSYIYLCSIPVLVTILGLTTGHLAPKFYVPIWLLNFAVMALATRTLGANILTKNSTDPINPDPSSFNPITPNPNAPNANVPFSDNRESRYLAAAGAFLILPICFLAILFGMGPPPDTIENWVATATEQKVRFDIILAGGIFVALGLSILKLATNQLGEKLFSQLGYTAIIIALPLFFIVTAFWHSFALESFKIKLDSATHKSQDWYHPAAQQIWIITIGEVLLTYFAAAMFAASLRLTGLFRRTPAAVYIIFSTLAILSILLFPLYPGATSFTGFPYFPFMVPAVPITLCYYIGVNLIRRAGTHHIFLP